MTEVEKGLCGVTKIKVKTIKFTWTICNYSFIGKKNGEYLSSPLFSIPENENVKFIIDLYPYGNSQEVDSVGVFLKLKCQQKTDDSFHVKFTFIIVDSKQSKKVNISGEKCYKDNESYGFGSIVKQSYIRDKANNLLPDDKLTIVCKVTLGTSVTSDLLLPFQKRIVQDYQFNKNIGLLLDDEELTDTILVARDKEFKVHKAILAAQSPVFMAMFRNDMIEKKENRVELTNLDGNMISEMLHYMYTGKVNHLDDHSSDLLKIADQYDIGGLKSMCESTLYNKLNINNVLEILILADSCNCQKLKNDIIEYIIAHQDVIIKSQEFKTFKTFNLHLTVEVLYEIVNSNLNQTQIREKSHCSKWL